MKHTRSTYTKKPDEKLTVDETRALVRSLVIETAKPAVVGARAAIVISLLAFVLATIALGLATWHR